MRQHTQGPRGAWGLGLALAFALACTGCTSKPGAEVRDQTKTDEAKPDDEQPKQGPPCESAADCLACSTVRGCGCEPSSKAQGCPEPLDSCFADPCSWSEPTCGLGHCALLPPSGPCAADEDCESRRHPFACEYIAVRAGAPRTTALGAMGCAGLPRPPAVRCELADKRCVIDEPAPEPTAAALDFEVRWSCEMHGVAISTRTIEVAGAPPSVTVTVNDDPPSKAELEARELAGLVDLLSGEDLATFVAETPSEGQPAPGMRYCTVSLRSAELSVTDKRWRSTDGFSDAAAAAEQALAAEIGQLATKVGP
jgi:hypothetical protein